MLKVTVVQPPYFCGENPDAKIIYIKGEDFTNQLIKALQDGKLGLGTIEDFRNKYRNTDVLLIDDIHFIAGKESTQEEFFNIFSRLDLQQYSHES